VCSDHNNAMVCCAARSQGVVKVPLESSKCLRMASATSVAVNEEAARCQNVPRAKPMFSDDSKTHVILRLYTNYMK
jgi:hypothetical protein